MKPVTQWLKSLAVVFVVAGSIVSANAAMSGTAWTDEAGFLARMIPDYYFTQLSPTFVSGRTFIDTSTGYGYTVGGRSNFRLAFTYPPAGPAPTGVGGFFGAGTDLTFVLSDNTSVKVTTDAATGFGGYTTDVDPLLLSIKSLTFSTSNLPTKLYEGLDTPIPEPSTILAGGLLLLPLAVSAVRRMRKSI